jgi:hypothetical protein
VIIYVGIPVMDGKPYASTVDSLLAEQVYAMQQGVHLLVEWEIGCSLIGPARNNLARRFLDTPECECMVFVDADISWPTGSLVKLAKSKHPVIGGTYRPKNNEDKFHVRGPVKRHGALYKVGGLPGGFIKIARKAFQKLDKVANRYLSPSGREMHDYFPTGFHNGTMYGEDYGFCRLYQEVGGTVWLDPSIILRHCGGYSVFSGDPSEWLERQ